VFVSKTGAIRGSVAVVTVVLVAVVHFRNPSPVAIRSESSRTAKMVRNDAQKQRDRNVDSTPVNQRTANWNRELQASNDYFAFVSKAAPKALAGDGRAALLVSKALRQCLLMTRLYGNEVDPEAAFSQALATQAVYSTELAAQKEKEFHECKRFFKDDPFVDLPSRDGGYSSPRFWGDLAYQSNDPIAQTFHAAAAIGSPISPKPGSLEIAQSDLNQAISSGDPEAIFRAGLIISNGLYVDPFQGYAVSLAACDLGFNCSASNTDDILFQNCVAISTCETGAAFSDVVIKAIGSDGYAQAYARAQEIESALARGDTGALEQFAQLKH
jgi:hypothetical protein